MKTKSKAATSARQSGGFIVLTLEFHREGRLWVGVCRELGTATDGRSLEHTKQELSRLVALHLSGLEDIDERGRLFEERGVKVFTDQPKELERVRLPKDLEDTFVHYEQIPVALSRNVPVLV